MSKSQITLISIVALLLAATVSFGASASVSADASAYADISDTSDSDFPPSDSAYVYAPGTGTATYHYILGAEAFGDVPGAGHADSYAKAQVSGPIC